MTSDEQLFSSPGSVQEEFTKESLRERIMFFETKKVPTDENAAVQTESSCAMIPSNKLFDECKHQQWTDATSEEEAPFASSELESLPESFVSLLSAAEGDGADLASSEAMAADRKADDIETKPLEKAGSESIYQRCRLGQPSHPGIKNNCQLPSSFELVNDFRKSEARPSFLKYSSTLGSVGKLNSRNLYSHCGLVLSEAHLSSVKSEFRSPGQVMSERPRLQLSHSVISEGGVLHYIKVYSAASSWYLLKSLENPELDLISISKDDSKLSVFIVSDVVTSRFRRTNYLLLNGLASVGRFVGQSLCICINGRCIRALRAKHVEKKGKTKMLVDGVELELSCEIERDEWVKTLNMC